MFNLCIQFNLRIGKGAQKLESVAESPKTRNTAIRFSEYARKETEHTKGNHCFSTAKNYRTAICSFIKFRKGKDIVLSKIDKRLMEDYEKWLKENNICLNTISCYLRSLRAIYNKAVSNELIEQKNPFKNVFTGNETTRKRAIGSNEINKLQAISLKSGSVLQTVRDIFLFSFYACGIPFIDIAFMKKDNIKDGYLIYKRHKTQQKISIKLEPCMQEIIDRYWSADGDYVFPFITNYDKEKSYRQYRSRLCYYNSVLKKLRDMAGISGNLTSYVPRHTWASLAFESNVDMSVISKALGHTTTNTTQTYIKGINNTLLYDANKKLLKKIIDYNRPLYKRKWPA